jgi:enoyl-[acyl-carrier protein] reductase I
MSTTEDNFTKSFAISCYSFTAVAQRAEKPMPNGGSMLTLTIMARRSGCRTIM